MTTKVLVDFERLVYAPSCFICSDTKVVPYTFCLLFVLCPFSHIASKKKEGEKQHLSIPDSSAVYNLLSNKNQNLSISNIIS